MNITNHRLKLKITHAIVGAINGKLSVRAVRLSACANEVGKTLFRRLTLHFQVGNM